MPLRRSSFCAGLLATALVVSGCGTPNNADYYDIGPAEAELEQYQWEQEAEIEQYQQEYYYDTLVEECMDANYDQFYDEEELLYYCEEYGYEYEEEYYYDDFDPGYP